MHAPSDRTESMQLIKDLNAEHDRHMENELRKIREQQLNWNMYMSKLLHAQLQGKSMDTNTSESILDSIDLIGRSNRWSAEVLNGELGKHNVVNLDLINSYIQFLEPLPLKVLQDGDNLNLVFSCYFTGELK